MELPKTIEGILFKQQREPQLYDAALFVMLAIAFSAIAYFALSQTDLLQQYAAYSATPVLNGLGAQASVAPGAVPQIVGANDGNQFTAEILPLCGGALELAVLWGLVAATRDRTLRQRAFGIAVGTIVLLAFNPLRIALSLKLYGSPNFVLAHDVLFRISIVIVLIGSYAAWYILLTRSAKSKHTRDSKQERPVKEKKRRERD